MRDKLTCFHGNVVILDSTAINRTVDFCTYLYYQEYTTLGYDSTDSETSHCVGGVAKQQLRLKIKLLIMPLLVQIM